jgi:thioredoxin-related protein
MMRGKFGTAAKVSLGLVTASVMLCASRAPARAVPPARSSGPQNIDAKDEDPWIAARGKVVVLIFVRTDCPVANRYAPEIQRLRDAHVSHAAFWMVYPDKKESAEAIRQHQREFRLTLPVLRDADRRLMKRAEVSVTPEAAVFDPQGRLVYHGRIDNWFEEIGRARPAATTHELADAIAAARSGHPHSLPNAPAIGCYLSDLP